MNPALSGCTVTACRAALSEGVRLLEHALGCLVMRIVCVWVCVFVCVCICLCVVVRGVVMRGVYACALDLQRDGVRSTARPVGIASTGHP